MDFDALENALSKGAKIVAQGRSSTVSTRLTFFSAPTRESR